MGRAVKSFIPPHLDVNVVHDGAPARAPLPSDARAPLSSGARAPLRFVVLAIVALVALTAAATFLPPLARAALIVLVAIVLWSTAALPEHVVALGFFLVVLLAGVAPPGVVLSGFESQALWLIFTGLIVGVAVKRTGLADRLAATLVARAGERYAGVIAMVIVAGLALSFVMPSSMGRVVMLMPIATALADRLGYAVGSRGRTGVVFAAVLGAYLPSAGVLPANLPNVILAAAAEQLYDYRFTYTGYLQLAFPVLGLGKALLIGLLLVALYRDRPALRGAAPAVAPWSADERAMALVLAVALGFWLTDALHGIAPAWIALGAAVVCMLPGVRLFPPDSFNRDLSYAAVFHAAGIIGLGAVVAHSGLGSAMGDALIAFAPFRADAPLANFVLLAIFSTLVCLVTTTPGVPAVLTPIAGQLADASGLPLEAVFLAQIVGFANPLLPYQSAPIVFALHFAGLSLRGAAGLLLALGALTLAVLAPLAYLWWRWLAG